MTDGPTIGVLTKLVGGSYFGGILTGIVHSAKEAGGRVVAIQTLDSGLTDEETLRTPSFGYPLADAHVDAWIVVGTSVATRHVDFLKSAGKPLALVSTSWPDGPWATVIPDNDGGVRTAIAHLVEHGHQRIAFVGDLNHHDVAERYSSYTDAMSKSGLALDATLVYVATDNRDDAGRECAARFIQDGLPATAVLCGTDLNAVGFMNGLSAAGFSVPGDVAVVGFDDEELAAHVSPSLSTVRQGFESIGRAATSVILSALTGGSLPARHLVPTAYVARESCGCTPTSPLRSRPLLRRTQTVRTVTARLCDQLDASRADDGDASAVTECAERVTGAVVRILAGDPHGDDIDDLSSRLYDLSPRDESVAPVATAIHTATRALVDIGADVTPDKSMAVDEFVRLVVLTTTRVHLRRQRTGHNFFQRVQRAQYEISMDLLRRREVQPQELRWLERTALHAGCFGRWAEHGPAVADDIDDVSADLESASDRAANHLPSLDIVGFFVRDGDFSAPNARRVPLRDFPSRSFLGLADATHDAAVLVLPVKVGASDWGWLAVVGPVEKRIMSGRGSTDQWAALLAVALDSETLLDSLRQQREHLTTAYQRERALVEVVRSSEERYALAMRAANDGLWDWDLTTNEIYYSDRWKEMLGYGPEDIGTSPDEWFNRVYESDRASLLAAINRHVRGEGVALEHEHRIVARDETHRWVLTRGLRVADGSDVPVRIVGSSTDITERKELEERLRRDATYDPVTGLPNRVLFLEQLRRAVEHTKRERDHVFAVLFLDLDGFKVVNDSLGHLFGDKLLVAVAVRLQEHLRARDIAARFGGDEFAVLLNNVDHLRDVSMMAERLQATLAAPFDIDGQQVVISAGIGIALSITGYECADDVLRDADIAMYQAKAVGGGTHVIFDVEMHARAVHRLSVEGQLRAAIDSGGLELHYQPIVSLETHELDGFEALVRWQHPDRGLLQPHDFLQIAEEASLTIPMGRWILQEACRRIREWESVAPAHRGAKLSLNVSNRQFWHKSFLALLERTLIDTGLDPQSLRLEITEGVIMHNPELADTMMRRLHRLGFPLHIDDFGTGYSSLEALHRFPIDALKIDRSFVARLDVDKRSSKIVRTIVLMGHDLEVDVIAEGVETKEQAEQLAALDCGYAQGHWFSHAVTGEEATRMLRNWQPLYGEPRSAG
ncbi:MAG: hypothetical protein JWM93_1717 [Frankiales bacterium]|nr:hypothetical protein [Frankiales bacterium]